MRTPTAITILAIVAALAGFDPDAPASGMGLALMRERAAEMDAELTVTSQPGAGTTVEVRLP